MQMMANVLGREIRVPQIDRATAVGAAIHGAVAAGVVSSYAEGAGKYGAKSFRTFAADSAAAAAYESLYHHYRALGADMRLREVMHAIGGCREGQRQHDRKESKKNVVKPHRNRQWVI